MDVACLRFKFDACPCHSDTYGYDLGNNTRDKRVRGGFKPYSQLYERYFMEHLQQCLCVIRSSSAVSDMSLGCNSALLRSVSCVFSGREVISS